MVSQASDSGSQTGSPAGESASCSPTSDRAPADLNKSGKPEINQSACCVCNYCVCNRTATEWWRYSVPAFCPFLALENSRHTDRFDCKGQPVTTIKLTREFDASPLAPVEIPSDYLSKCFNDVCGCDDILCKRRHVFRAAKNGDGDVIREFLSCGGNPNMTEADEDFGKYPPFAKWSLLHRASLSAFLDIMRDLITAGADPDIRNHHGETPFHLAAMPSNRGEPILSALNILACAGANVRAVDNYGKTALHNMMWIIATSHLQKTVVVKHLVKLGVPPRATDNKRRTPLDIAKIMLEKGDDDNDSIVRFLELEETGITGPAFCPFLALENRKHTDRFDCKRQPVTIIRLTREFDASPLAPVEIPFDYLSKCFNDVCGCDDIFCKRRHVFRAAKNGDGDVIREFLSCGGNPNMTEANEDFGKYPSLARWSLLHRASYSAFLDIMRDLITAGADPDIRNHYGETPFHLAAMPFTMHADKPVLSALNILACAGANVRAVDNYGKTALHNMMWNIAASHLQKTVVVKHLVKLGVPPRATDNERKTPLDIAKIMLEKGDDDNDSIVRFLELEETGVTGRAIVRFLKLEETGVTGRAGCNF